jgi:hypothetical protein
LLYSGDPKRKVREEHRRKMMVLLKGEEKESRVIQKDGERPTTSPPFKIYLAFLGSV